MSTLNNRHLNGQLGDEMNDLLNSFIIGQTIVIVGVEVSGICYEQHI